MNDLTERAPPILWSPMDVFCGLLVSPDVAMAGVRSPLSCVASPGRG